MLTPLAPTLGRGSGLLGRQDQLICGYHARTHAWLALAVFGSRRFFRIQIVYTLVALSNTSKLFGFTAYTLDFVLPKEVTSQIVIFVFL